MELIRSIPVKTPGNPFDNGPCRLGLLFSETATLSYTEPLLRQEGLFYLPYSFSISLSRTSSSNAFRYTFVVACDE